MREITDPNELNEFMQGAEVMDFSGQQGGAPAPSQPVEDKSWYDFDGGRVVDSLKQGLRTTREALVAGGVSPEYSNYANARARREAERLKNMEADNSIVENIAAGVGRYAPAIGAGMVNPYLGAAAATGIATGDAMVEQAKEGMDINPNTALAAGAATGAIDLATGGLGNQVIKQGMKFIPKPTTFAGKAATRLAEDVTSAVGGEAAINLAAGRDATDNLGTAALMGGAAGATLRGGIKAATNPKALADELSSSFGGTKPKDEFVNQVAAERTRNQEAYDKVDSSVSDADLDTNVDALIKATQNNSYDSAARAIKILQDNDLPLTDAAMGAKVPSSLRADADSVMLGEVIGGLDLASVRKAGDVAKSAKRGWFDGGDINKGFTREEHQIRVQDSYDKAALQVLGTFSSNKVKGQELLTRGLEDGSIQKGSAIEKDFTALNRHLRELEENTKGISGRHKKDISDSTEFHTKEFMKLSKKLGISDQFADEAGNVGRWNPLETMQTANAMELIGSSQMRNIHQANTDPNVNSNSLSGKALGVLTGGLYTGARGASRLIGEMRSRGKLAKTIKKGSKRATDLEKAIQEKLKTGDLAGAAREAELNIGGGLGGVKPTTARPRKGASEASQEAPIVSEPTRTQGEPEAPQQGPERFTAEEWEAQQKSRYDAEEKAATEAPKEKLRTAIRPTKPKEKAVADRTPAYRKDIEKYKDENKQIDRLISNNEDAPQREDFLASVGSLSGLKDMHKKSTNKGESLEAFFNREYKKDVAAKKVAQSEADAKVREEEAVKTEKAEAERVKGMDEEKLVTKARAADIDDADLAAARTKVLGDDPVTSKNLGDVIAAAKAIRAGREKEASKIAAEAAEAAKTATAKASLAAQRGKVTKLLNSVKGAGKEFEEFKSTIQGQMKRSMKPLTDAKLESIHQKFEETVKAEIRRLSEVVRKTGDEQAKDIVDSLRGNIGQSKELIKLMREDLEALREATVKEQKLRKEKETAEATLQSNMEKVKKETADYEKALDYGYSNGLDVKAVKKLKAKATKDGVFGFNQFKKLVDEDASQKSAKKQADFERKFEGATKEQLDKHALDIISKDMASAGLNTDGKAALAALESKGLGTDTKELVRVYSDAIEKGMARKEAFPNNPELWLSRDTINSVQDLMRKTPGSSGTGSVGTRLRAKIFDTDKKRSLMTEEAIQKVIDRKQKKGGKLEGEDVKEKLKGRNMARLRRLQK